MKFVWNDKKAEANARKQGVHFDEAATVFGDPLAGTFVDEDQSIGKQALDILLTRDAIHAGLDL